MSSERDRQMDLEEQARSDDRLNHTEDDGHRRPKDRHSSARPMRELRRSSLDRVGDAIFRALARAGIGPAYLLTTRGRKTGRLRTNPVILVEQNKQRWLVAPYGAVSWVLNARAAGQVTLRRGRDVHDYTIREVPAAEAGPVLKRYIGIASATRPYFHASKDAPVEDFIAEAQSHPVIALTRLTGQTDGGLVRGLYRLKQWMYRGGRPHGLAQAMNRLSAIQFSSGLLAPRNWVTLEVRGRRTGRLISFPVVVTDLAGERYLVSMLGEDANWVHNVRAAGGRATLRRRGSEDVRLEEVESSARAPILRRYLALAPGARPHFPVDRHAPIEEFERISAQFPVFRITAAASGAGGS